MLIFFPFFIIANCLSFNGVSIFLVSLRGEGRWELNLSIPYLFVKTQEKVIRLCTVLILFSSLKIWEFFYDREIDSLISSCKYQGQQIPKGVF